MSTNIRSFSWTCRKQLHLWSGNLKIWGMSRSTYASLESLLYWTAKSRVRRCFSEQIWMPCPSEKKAVLNLPANIPESAMPAAMIPI